MNALPNDSAERQRYAGPLARVARLWFLLPLAIICAIFSWLVHQTEGARVNLAKAQYNLKTVQGEVTKKLAASADLTEQLQQLQTARTSLAEELKQLQEKSASQEKELQELKEQGDLLWKLAAKDPPSVVSAKVIRILGAEDARQRAQTLYLAGKIAMEHRDYPRAQSLLSDAVTELPSYTEALNALGLVFARQGRLKDAEDVYLRAAAADPSYFYPLQNVAVLYYQQKEYAKARTYARQGLAIKPNYKPLVDLLKDIDKASPP